jgi:hypothetical protein
VTTSGTSTFNLDLNDIFEEAFERCGAEIRTGYDHRTARRSLNLLTIEWANRGINLWTIEEGEIVLETGRASYDLPVDTIDLVEHVIRTQTASPAQADLTITRISVSTYATIPNKLIQGRPIQVWVDRQSGASYPPGGRPVGTNPSTGIDNPKIVVWPTPNDPGNQYRFVYWRLRRMQDAGNGINTQDIPFRFLNCLIAGLAYYLSMKIASVDQNRRAELKLAYEEQWKLAAEEDREKAAIRFVPRRQYLGSGT